jgi:hypothetical protein
MAYNGFDGAQWGTGLATSPDLLNWTKDPANPIMLPNGDEGYISGDGSIVYKAGTYYHAYNSGDWQIRMATSTDLHIWDRKGVIIALGGAGEFDQVSCADICMKLLDDGSFLIVYCGAPAGGEPRKFGYATSANGLAWTKRGILFDPLVPSGNHNGEPYLVDTGSQYTIFCDAGLNGSRGRIDEWITVDGGANFYCRPRVLDKGSLTWEDTQVFDSCVIKVSGKLYMFYAGSHIFQLSQGMGAQIGLAIGDY